MKGNIKLFLGAVFLASTLFCANLESSPVTDNAIREAAEDTFEENNMPTEEEVSAPVGTVKVGCVKGTGFISEDRPGHKIGYGYEYMEFLSNYAHCDFEYIEYDNWSDLVDAIANREVDVAPGMPGDYHQLQGTRRTDHVIGRFPMELILSKDGVKPNMKIGNLNSNYPTPGLPGISQSEGFEYEIVNFRNFPDLMDAFTRGEIDGFVAPMLVPHSSENVIALFDRQSYRLSVRDDNPELYNRLNLGMDQLLLTQSNIRDKLNQKYMRVDGFPLILSKTEKDYLAERKKLRTAIFLHQQPYAYYNANNELIGVVPDLLNKIAQDLNIEIEIVPTETISEAGELIQKGEIDFIADAVCDPSWAKNFHMKPTQSYLSMDYVPVTREGDLEKDNSGFTVACIDDMFHTEAFIYDMFPEDRRFAVASPEAALVAVAEGRADVAYIRRNSLASVVENSGTYLLTPASESIYSEPVSFGVYDKADPHLWHILNKSISHIDSDYIRDAINKYQQVDVKITPQWLLYHHPFRVLAGILLVLAIITGLLVYRNRMKKQHIELVEHMAYTDLRYNLPNVPWLEQNVPVEFENLESDNPNVQTFFVVFSMASTATVAKEYGRKIIDKQFMTMSHNLAKDEPVIFVAAGIDVEHLICFCKAEDLDSIKAWAEEAIQKYSYMETADVNSKIILKIRAGVSAYSRMLYVQQAIDRAVMACHQNSKDDVVVFDEKLEEQLTMQHTIESRMEQALRDGEFQAWYQPKYDIRTRRIVGAEALVRWISPELGFMPPGKFIPLFEQNGFVIPVDHYLLEKTCQLQRERLDAGKEVVPISVNQSRLHMTEDGYLEKMKAVVEKYNLPAGLIELEVTETVFGDFDSKSGQKDAAEIIKGLHDLGFTISVDDFGSGYSSYTMLGNLPMDVLKIDRSILVGADTSSRMRQILGNVIKLGKALKMKVICEGIETVEQENLLLELGCYLGQGFLNAKPMPVADFVNFFEKRNADVEAGTLGK